MTDAKDRKPKQTLAGIYDPWTNLKRYQIDKGEATSSLAADEEERVSVLPCHTYSTSTNDGTLPAPFKKSSPLVGRTRNHYNHP